MMVEAGALLSDIPRKHSVAGAQLEQFIQEFYRIFYCRRARVRPEIAGFIFFHLPGKLHPGESLRYGDLDKRVCFIILQQRIIFRAVLLDQIIFQHQRFQLRIRHNIFKPRDLLHHLLDLRPPAMYFAKIGAHSVVQVYRFSHIEDRVRLVVHNIYARLCRQLF